MTVGVLAAGLVAAYRVNVVLIRLEVKSGMHSPKAPAERAADAD